MNRAWRLESGEDHLTLGIYEKAYPPGFDWKDRFSATQKIGFDFIEFSVDESQSRLARLDWDEAAIQHFVKLAETYRIGVPTLCLSALRSFPLGSSDVRKREQGLTLIERALSLAQRLGISIVQLAGYDVYGEPSTAESRERFNRQLGRALESARQFNIALAIENMETSATDSLTKVMEYVQYWDDPLLQAYVDVGNLIAMGYDLSSQLKLAQGRIAAMHIKDVLPGVCRDIGFGQGIVDFDQVFTAIRDIGYQGLLVAEMWAAPLMVPDPVAEAERAYHFISDKLNL